MFSYLDLPESRNQPNNPPDEREEDESSEIYVGGLPRNITRTDLYNIFSAFGEDCQIALDRRCIHKPQARIKYSSSSAAQLAINSMNKRIIRDKRIIVAHFQHGMSFPPELSIFVQNLDKSVTEKDLYEVFAPYGQIVKYSVALDDWGISKGFGYILFAEKEFADLAIERSNNTIYKSKRIIVTSYLKKNDIKNPDNYNTTLFIKNLPRDNFSKDEILKLFLPFGEIVTVTVKNSCGRAFSFVRYKQEADAKKAIEGMNNRKVESTHLIVQKSQTKEERGEESQRNRINRKAEKNCTIYVQNFVPTTTEQMLREIFGNINGLTAVNICTKGGGRKMIGNNNQIKPVAYIIYENPEQAEQAVLYFNGRNLLGSNPSLYVSKLGNRVARQPNPPPMTHNTRNMQYDGIYDGSEVMNIPRNIEMEVRAKIGAPHGMRGQPSGRMRYGPKRGERPIMGMYRGSPFMRSLPPFPHMFAPRNMNVVRAPRYIPPLPFHPRQPQIPVPRPPAPYDNQQFIEEQILRMEKLQISDNCKYVNEECKELREEAKMKEEKAREDCICPITLDLMKDPVVAADGRSYEREAISKWLENHNTSPCTNQQLPQKHFIPNIQLKNIIQTYIQ